MRWRAEWVGGAVLVFCVAASWSICRGATAGRAYPQVRLVGVAVLGALTVGMWIGSTVNSGLGALLVAAGCCLSVWSVLLRLRVTWRNHVRPTTVPAVLAVMTAVFGWHQPAITAMAFLLILIWARRIRQAAAVGVDQQMNALVTLSVVKTSSVI